MGFSYPPSTSSRDRHAPNGHGTVCFPVAIEYLPISMRPDDAQPLPDEPAHHVFEWAVFDAWWIGKPVQRRDQWTIDQAARDRAALPRVHAASLFRGRENSPRAVLSSLPKNVSIRPLSSTSTHQIHYYASPVGIGTIAGNKDAQETSTLSRKEAVWSKHQNWRVWRHTTCGRAPGGRSGSAPRDRGSKVFGTPRPLGRRPVGSHGLEAIQTAGRTRDTAAGRRQRAGKLFLQNPRKKHIGIIEAHKIHSLPVLAFFDRDPSVHSLQTKEWTCPPRHSARESQRRAPTWSGCRFARILLH